jgi:hypothetical protein
MRQLHNKHRQLILMGYYNKYELPCITTNNRKLDIIGPDGIMG